jgi:dihydrofolate synthase/folylpolyglutamate synthase
LRNLALAIAAAEQLHDFGFSISPQQIGQGIRETRWPARLQIFPAEDGYPEVVIDVAHNPAGAWALRAALSARYEDRPLTLVFGAMRDKAIAEIADILFPLVEQVIATHAENPRAASTSEIVALGQHTQTEIMQEFTVSSALERACLLAGAKGVIVVTGSIYIAGEALSVLAQKPTRQGI